jgi:hypothetical protein
MPASVGCKARESLWKISRSEVSIPIGAIKNNWKRKFRRAIIIMIGKIPNTSCSEK